MPIKKFLITGIVQGVGFRPFCARLAREIGVSGWVCNTHLGVLLQIEGSEQQLAAYMMQLPQEAPILSVIRGIEELFDINVSDTQSVGFEILLSQGGQEKKNRQSAQAMIPPDLNICGACFAELFDKNNRRYLYPFINCTDCGPRYSIIKALPYDRAFTTMSDFPMCADCEREYCDPTNRRFHAQPNACPVCGPHVWSIDTCGNKKTKEDAIKYIINSIKNNKIAAIKGLGGFHLACLASDDEPIAALRARKKRADKPFAIMARDLACAEKLVTLSDAQKEALLSQRRPIVLAQRKPDACRYISDLAAPRQDTLGIMLPYTPLHCIIMNDFDALVMTSANVSDSPLISDNEEALRALASIADVFLLHDRKIENSIDDSVVSFTFLRRARGYVPQPMFLENDFIKKNIKEAKVFASGGELKSSFALLSSNTAFLSPYIGDLKEYSVERRYIETARKMTSLYKFHPDICAADKHPMYRSTALAKGLFPEIETVYVQHHHAHLVSAAADNGIARPAVAWILDGTGYGDDGSIWGGELLYGDMTGFERLGYFLPAPLVGGDASVLEPWRFAAVLISMLGDDMASTAADIFGQHILEIENIFKILKIFNIANGNIAPLTSSCGRLFDGIAAILGKDSVSYDGQAAMELEAMSCVTDAALPFDDYMEGAKWVLDWRPAVGAILDEMKDVNKFNKNNKRILAGAFHNGLANALVRGAVWACKNKGTKEVIMSGGCFQNKKLADLMSAKLQKTGLNPVFCKNISPNDEGIALGQAIIAANSF